MISVIIPTLNASEFLPDLLTNLKQQTVKDKEIIIIDSSSTDNTIEIAKLFRATTIIIPKEEFDHGRTRNFAAKEAKGDIIVYLTQDALPINEYSIKNLIKPFSEDEKIGATYGRQLPRPIAGAIEAHARLFNYPPENRIKTIADIHNLGIKTIFISNSFAAYRRSALMDVDWFPSNTIMKEDAYVAAKMLLKEWKIAYCADACVYHSHNYRPLEEFRRYFDIGVFHIREPWIRQSFGQAESEGMRYVCSELKYLWNKNSLLIPSAILRTVLKVAGYRLGLMEQYLPIWLKRRLSMHKGFWSL